MSIFSGSQKHQLKNVLGEHYAALLPLLEDAARPVDGPRGPWEYKIEAKACPRYHAVSSQRRSEQVTIRSSFFDLAPYSFSH